jgi:ABC-2 type transport system permease protein
MTETRPSRPAPPAPGAASPVGRVVLAQSRHAVTGFARTPIAAFFTLAFPLIWLSLIVLLVGNDPVETPIGTVTTAQFLTPAATVFAVVMAAFTSLAIAVSLARERGELKRLRGTPAPTWTYLAGHVISALIVALLGTVIMIAAGVGFFGVELVQNKLPAMIGTLLVGICCFAALGLAVAATMPNSSITQAVTTGSVMVLAFISDIFLIGADLPAALDGIGWAFPLRHFTHAMAETFDPFGAGAGWSPDHLAVLAAWGIAGAVIAVRRLQREAGGPRRRGRGGRRSPRHTSSARPAGRTSTGRLLVAQMSYGNRTLWRDAGAWFFALAFPVLLLVLMGSIWGTDIAQDYVPGVAVWGAAVTAFINVPEAVALGRQRGVLKRLRGTPLPMWGYVTGWLGTALWMAMLCLAVVVLLGAVGFGVELNPAGLPAAVVVVGLGTLVLAALGMALMSVLPDPRTLSVVALAVLLPLSFVSGLFAFGADPPDVVRTIGGLFPLQHLRDALDEALTGDGWFPVDPVHLLVVLAWGVAGTLLAVRLLGRSRS